MVGHINNLQRLEPGAAARLVAAVADSGYSQSGKQQIVNAIDTILVTSGTACTPPSAKKGRLGEQGTRVSRENMRYISECTACAYACMLQARIDCARSRTT